MKAIGRTVALAFVLALAWVGVDLAQTPPAPAAAGPVVGIVLIHGKSGSPSNQPILNSASLLTNAGYKVDRPEMCWSGQRIYDQAFPDCLSAIDQSIARLKALGATAIVLAGHSLGGTGMLAYGATHPGLMGLIGLAPAGNPNVYRVNQAIGNAVAQAQQLVAAGKGDEKTGFPDVNTGANGQFTFTVTTTPRIYLSFFGPNTQGGMMGNVAKISAPLLWVAGDKDPTQKDEPDAVFAKAAANPMNRFVKVAANHMETPAAAVPAILTWLGDLKRR